MRIPIAMLCLAFSAALAFAQSTPAPNPVPNPTTDQGNPTGSPAIPEKMGTQQPQGKTGPLETSGQGTPPESPQGDTPSGMQADPTRPTK